MDTSVQRRKAIIEALNERQLEALIAVSSGFHSFLEPNLVFVLSGVKTMGEAAVVVGIDGSSVLIATPKWDEERIAAAATTDRVICADDMPSALEELLTADRLKSASLGIDGLQQMSLATGDRLGALLEGKASDLDSLVRHIARCRSPQEIERSRRATHIAEEGYERLLAAAKPGMREFELAADLLCFMKERGGDDNFLLMSASQHNFAVRAAGNRVLERGDIILAEITPSFEGQFAQVCRTVAIGEPPAAYAEKYAILQESMRLGQKAAVPGTRMSEVAEIMNGPLRDAGYGEYCRPPYMRVRGHGLGLTSNLPGDVSVDNDIVLEEGMVFVMHPNQYLPETGYLMCGEPVVITPSGAEAFASRTSAPDWIDP